MYSTLPIINIIEIVICPRCHYTIPVTAQLNGGALTKKGTHQVYSTDLVWRALIAKKGSRTMEEFLKQMLHDFQEAEERRLASEEVQSSIEPVPPAPRRQQNKIRVNTLGRDDEKNKSSKVK